MHEKHGEPDGEHNAKSYFGEATLQLFECTANVPRSQRCYCSHQNTRMRQSYEESSGGNVMVRGKAKRSQVQRHGQHIHYPNFHHDHTRVAWRVEHRSWIVDMPAPVAHVYEPE